MMLYLGTVLALYGVVVCRGEAFAEKPSVKPVRVLIANASPLPAGRSNTTPTWAVPSLRYRVLVEVLPANVGRRASDQAPACLELDIHSPALAPLKLRRPIDLDSIQVIRYDPITGKTLPGPPSPWPFARTPGERASRFLDKSLPWDFPTAGAQAVQGSKVPTFPRGAFLCNVRGAGNPGLLVWDHTQDGRQSSYYAVYFNTLPKGAQQKPARQGFIGDGSPRRDITNSSLTGTLYNRVAVDDWDGDGLSDLLIGGGLGYILLYRNEGDKYRPRFGQGEYLRDATENILNAGGMSSPCVADWNGDGKKDLLVGIESSACLVWYENVGTNKNRKMAYRGFIRADGKEIVLPPKPCPETPHYTRDYAPSVEVVDWNGDGKLDLLLGGYITGYIWYYENVGVNPDGTPRLTFQGPLEADGKPLDTIWGAHPCAADLNGDGKLDLLSGSFGQAMGGGDTFHKFLLYYENTGTRAHPRLTEKPVQYEGAEPREILAQARVLGKNRRGLTDLVISTYTKVYIAENVGTKTAPKWKLQLLEAPWGISPLSATQLMDWNGDGYVDLINSPLDSDSSPTIHLNRGKGTHGVFGPPQPLLPPGQTISHRAPYGDQWTFTYLYDFDRDGDLDILWADGPGNVYLHRNNGNNQSPDYDTKGEKLMLTNGQPIKVGPPVVPIEEIKDFDMMQGSRACVTAFDFNGDGRTDVVVGDTYGDIFYFENAGNDKQPVFRPGLKLGNLVSRALPLTYDWDHDGRMDVVGVSWAGRMEWYRNRGSGANPLFAAPQKFILPPTVMYSPRIVIGDWNGDGDDDILVMSSYPWFCWLEASYIQNGYAPGRILSVEQKGSSANNALPQSKRPGQTHLGYTWLHPPVNERAINKTSPLNRAEQTGCGHRRMEDCLENQRSSTTRPVVFAREAHTWTQKGFRDFRAGTCEDGGANLYVTASGRIRSIYTFDYNRDGANDLLFVCGHNVNDCPPTSIYMNSGQGLDTRYRWGLLNEGAQSGLVADLNKDGYPDMVLCGTTNGMATRAPLDSIVYYGSDKGFFPIHTARLPTFFSRSVACADLNGDGLDELIFNQSDPHPVIIYWNASQGFDRCKKTELPIKAAYIATADIDGDGRADLLAVTPKGVSIYRGNDNLFDLVHPVRMEVSGATHCVVADLNKDGKPDLVVANGEPDSHSAIFWNNGNGYASGRRTLLPTVRAQGCAVGDLNNDGYPDIAFAQTSLQDGRKGEIDSVVYWGDGFSPNRKLALPTQWASRCAIGDINGDGFADLVFSNRTSLRSLDTDSFVYWGGKDGLSVERRQRLPSYGATDVAIADVNGDRLADVVLFNGSSGFNGERYLRIYWNDGQGSFSTERKTEIPAFDPFNAICADFNNDGYLDIACPNSYEYSIQGEGVDQGSFIYWGDASGTWSEKRLTKLKTITASGMVTADLNRDGYLDLVIPQYADPQKRQLIFWGGADGFRNDRVTVLHMPNPRGVTLADFNKDGWLDIVITDLDAPEIPIFWGGAEGYSDSRKTGLPNGGSVTANAADFNNDGWLDLLVCNFYEGKNRIENTNSFVYYGGPQGFRDDRRALLPTTGADQASIADFNKDGWLDIAIGNYATGAHDRMWFSFVYWGGPQGFSSARRSDLYTNSGSGNLALDFNKDGWLDLAMACHKQANGDHSTYSYLFWGGPNGFNDKDKMELPTDGAHEMTMMDPGNIYTRRFELGYVSRVYDAGRPRKATGITWKAEERLGARLRFQLRGASTREALAQTAWNESVRQIAPARYWQYRAVFHSEDGSNYPALDEVTVTFE